jgi:hypothetical protein
MTNKYKEAFQSAEQEIEEKSIAQLKETVKQILQKKRDLEEERDELDEEIKLLKQDIDDFKAGRLDKVKERHECDERAQDVFPLTINIIRQEIVTKPWTWTYEIQPRVVYTTPQWVGGTLATAGTSGLSTICLTGNTAQAFTVGSYNLNNGIVNL